MMKKLLEDVLELTLKGEKKRELSSSIS